MDENARLAEDVRRVLWPERPEGGFDPVASWADLGLLLETLEARGCYLMTNSVSDPELRRTASLHQSTPEGYPCIGSSEWGAFPRLGEAVLRAAHEALFRPRVGAE